MARMASVTTAWNMKLPHSKGETRKGVAIPSPSGGVELNKWITPGTCENCQAPPSALFRATSSSLSQGTFAAAFGSVLLTKSQHLWSLSLSV